MRIDFTSARFLGLGARADPLAPPNLGKPAWLAEPPGAECLARAVASAQGAAEGLVARSTLHALCDLLAVADAEASVLVDEHCYPITVWATRAVREGGTMVRYRHRDPRHVQRLLAGSRRPAVVVADAWCAGCLRPAPLGELAEAAESFDAVLVVDDSLAFGVLGTRGRGTPSWLGLGHEQVLWVASAGKAFGTPLALITGPADYLGRIRRGGPNRVHSSPPSTGDVAALSHAFAHPRLREVQGRVAGLARAFRAGAASLGVRTLGAPLPLVGLDLPGGTGRSVVDGLARRGVDVLLTRSRCRRVALPMLCVRADHSEADLAAAVDALADVVTRAA